jgi:hypothetical protein
MLDTMDEVDRRGWAVPSAQGRLGGIDLARCPGGRGRPPAPHPGRAPALPQVIDRDVDEVGIGGKPVSPRLHLSMHKIVANQLWDDEPPQTRQTARLLALGYQRHDVPHMLGSVVAGESGASSARTSRSTAHASQRPSTPCPAHGEARSQPAIRRSNRRQPSPRPTSPRWMQTSCVSAAPSRTRRRPRPRWEPGGPPTVQPRSPKWRGSPSPPATRACGCSRSRPSIPRIPRRSRWSVACARPAHPPHTTLRLAEHEWRSRLRWTGRRHLGGARAGAGRAGRARRTGRGAGSGA